MAISDKLEYLNDTKQLLKDKINNLGGSIDDNTTFRQYANQLQNVYDNLPKTEYQEGTEVNLGVTTKGKLDYDNGVLGIGQSSQDSTQGYNILNPSLLSIFNNNNYIRTTNYTTQGTIEVKPSTTYRIYLAEYYGDGKIYEYAEDGTAIKNYSIGNASSPKDRSFYNR